MNALTISLPTSNPRYSSSGGSGVPRGAPRIRRNDAQTDGPQPHGPKTTTTASVVLSSSPDSLDSSETNRASSSSMSSASVSPPSLGRGQHKSFAVHSDKTQSVQNSSSFSNTNFGGMLADNRKSKSPWKRMSSGNLMRSNSNRASTMTISCPILEHSTSLLVDDSNIRKDFPGTRRSSLKYTETREREKERERERERQTESTGNSTLRSHSKQRLERKHIVEPVMEIVPATPPKINSRNSHPIRERKTEREEKSIPAVSSNKDIHAKPPRGISPAPDTPHNAHNNENIDNNPTALSGIDPLKAELEDLKLKLKESNDKLRACNDKLQESEDRRRYVLVEYQKKLDSERQRTLTLHKNINELNKKSSDQMEALKTIPQLESQKEALRKALVTLRQRKDIEIEEHKKRIQLHVQALKCQNIRAIDNSAKSDTHEHFPSTKHGIAPLLPIVRSPFDTRTY